MHTGQLFSAVCFWKNLIPDAVKYWFSLTSVKALIFLLRLNNLSNKIFLPFWASINDLTRTPSFHIAVSSSMPSSCPQPMAVVAVIPNRLSLVSLWLREAQRWWSWKLTRQLFLWLRLLFVERVEKWRSPRACWKNRENFLASANEMQVTFLLFTKRFLIQEMLDCIVYSMSLSLHIALLINVTSARVLTERVIIDQ